MADVYTQAMFPVPLCPHSRAPLYPNSLPRQGSKMAEMRAGRPRCVFHTLSQTGEPGGEIGMVSEEEFQTK